MTIQELHTLFLLHPQVSTDSRNITRGCLFFALKGPNFNGNLFAANALEQGASFVIADESEVCKDERYILVKDALYTLQQLARYHREQFSIPVLGISGSNGKTTTKELVSAVLMKKYHVVYSQGNLNNHIGVPLTLLNINKETDYAVIEMGANAPGEIGMLCELAKPTQGLITGIGKAHLGGFGDLDTIIKTKKALYDFVHDNDGICFVNADNPLLIKLTENYKSVLYGSRKNHAYSTRNLEHSPYIHVSFHYDSKEYFVKSRLIGNYNYANLQSAIAVGLENNISPLDIIQALEEYIPGNNRSQLMETGRNTIILDAYNANPTSMKASLESFIQMEGALKAVILGDMLELGEYEDEEHGQIIHWLGNYPQLKVFLIGPVFSRANKPAAYNTFADSASLREYLFQYPLRNFLILAKGSRGIAVEKVIDAL
ncbi:MAG: UDP-N-acetylmuramoyl-tripeptide--D-alanyl-D-alanine ligase [Bacteroidales bacterium]